MTRFMDRMADAGEALAEIQATLAQEFPEFTAIEIPTQLVNNVTLSTMHGCPPDEIERIACYLLEERGLHTTVKLNPTLLGRDTVLYLLHDELGFREIEIPDSVFEHDLQYRRAVEMIRTLQKVAAGQGLTLSVKLSNTLAMANHKGYLPGNEMYMSGRPLYPVTMTLFNKLAHEFRGNLTVSYSAGADALNVATILACGARPVTVASDLLKPGGYARMRQYIDQIEAAMRAQGVTSLDDLPRNKLARLTQAAQEARQNPRYKKGYFPSVLPKVASGLGLWDCIAAPCVEACAVAQDVPEYAALIGQGAYDRALAVILARNPLPAVTGYVCTHLCQTRCTRNNYDQPVAIRALKRFAAEHGNVPLAAAPPTGHRAAVIGSGPSGLAAAFYLALNGVQVVICEAQDVPSGMLRLAPAFRLPREVVEADLARIRDLGVEIELGHPITAAPETLLAEGFAAVYVACGFPQDAPLHLEGREGAGVHTALDLLACVASGEQVELGTRVLVIGGGNTAMDAARTARRLTGHPVTVVYRRTRVEMPAEDEEVHDLLVEGNVLHELVSPLRVVRQDGRVVGLECVRNELGEPDTDGRRKPVAIPRSEFTLPADSIIIAVGQAPQTTFLQESSIVVNADGTLFVDPETGQAGPAGVYAGGDAVRGPETIIAACADGRRAAEAICAQLELPLATVPHQPPTLSAEEIVQLKGVRARRTDQEKAPVRPPAKRADFALVEGTLSAEAAHREAGRCMQCAAFCDKCVEVCPNRANQTYMVSPLQWRVPVLACRGTRVVVAGKEPFTIEQARQLVHLADLCNECGNCATFCVHQGRPYLDKPRLFFHENAFGQAQDNAFRIAGNTIWRREGGQEMRLTRTAKAFIFEDRHVRLRISPDWRILNRKLKEPFEGPLSLRTAAEMRVLLQGVRASAPFLTGK
jgi:putative selenate reductase